MSRDAASSRSFLDELGELRRRSFTGALEIALDGQVRHLYLRDGELYLPGSHPLARHLSEGFGERSGGAASAASGEPFLATLSRIADHLATWGNGERKLREGAGALPSQLVGPMPTARLLMLASTSGADDAEIERRLGDPGGRFVAMRGADGLCDELGYTPEEAFLLERLRLPMSIAELLASSPVPRPLLLRRLLQLIALGAVCSETDAARSATSAEQERSEIVARIAERIERGLRDRPLELEPEEHRARVVDLLSRHGALDHYELLGVTPAAPAGQIQAGFEAVGRIVHPLHAARLGLAARRATFELLFERATLAYETLMDPERRRAYNARQMIEVPTVAPTGAAREAEQRELARQQYERALAFAHAGDVHSAVALLEQVVQTDPRAEYWIALGRQLARNPAWLRRALASFKDAILLDANNADAHLGLGEVYERLGELERARVQFTTVARSHPHHLAAAEKLAHLDELKASAPRPGTGGLLSRFFRRR